MRRRNITWVWLLGAAFMVGCGKQVPEDIIQPDRMENILYDYHLSISMGNNLSYSDNYQKEAYKNYVFEKYHITEADFDSSMVWYTRHTEELAGLYKKVGERFRSEKKTHAGVAGVCVRINRLHRCREILWMYGMTVNFIG